MTDPKRNTEKSQSTDRIIAEAKRLREQRENTYRERALKLFPWVCARCAREFQGKRLRELTVHHKDHNHDNNPPDGSNWELLCIYCHDNEHSRYQDEDWLEKGSEPREKSAGLSHQSLGGLGDLLKQAMEKKKKR